MPRREKAGRSRARGHSTPQDVQSPTEKVYDTLAVQKDIRTSRQGDNKVDTKQKCQSLLRRLLLPDAPSQNVPSPTEKVYDKLAIQKDIRASRQGDDKVDTERRRHFQLHRVLLPGAPLQDVPSPTKKVNDTLAVQKDIRTSRQGNDKVDTERRRHFQLHRVLLPGAPLRDVPSPTKKVNDTLPVQKDIRTRRRGDNKVDTKRKRQSKLHRVLLPDAPPQDVLSPTDTLAVQKDIRTSRQDDNKVDTKRKRQSKLHRVLLPDAPPQDVPSPTKRVYDTLAGQKDIRTSRQGNDKVDTKRKRQSQLHRVLLPDAPPRKRKTKCRSPEREPCVMIDAANVEMGLPKDAQPEPSRVPPVNDDPVHELHSDVSVEIIFDTETVPGPTNCDIDGPSFEAIMKYYMLNQDSDNEDLDVDIGIPITTRDVTDEQADDTGLSFEQIATLRKEEESSDRYLHDIVKSDDHFDFQWTNDPMTFTGKREIFTGRSGPTKPVTDKEVDVFYDMFDSDFIVLLVIETNRYADQVLTILRNKPSTGKNPRVNKWTPTDRSEMITFLTLLILQGLYPKTKEEAYFTSDGFGTMPYFALTMTYRRFHLLKSFLHFSDNETTSNTTKLRKIKPVIDYFNQKFSSLYTLGQEIALDESLLKWHGRLGFTQKIATKAAQVGIKTYELCESSSGYLWKFVVYTGKDGPTIQTDKETDAEIRNGPNTQTGEDDDNDDNMTMRQSATMKIVLDMTEPLLNRGHTLVMDNFYNSPLLARCLKKHKTDVFGTMRLTRQFVPDSLKRLTKTDLRQGEAVASYCSDLSVMVWRDNNLVSMISTYHPLRIGTQQKSNVHKYKPAIVLDYNKKMGGVDKKDQLLASQPLERLRTRIWYKKLFRRLFNDALHNCYVIYRAGNPGRAVKPRAFRKKLAEDLMRIHRQLDLTQSQLTMKRPVGRTVTGMTMPTSTLTYKETKRPYVQGNHFPAATGSHNTRCWLCTRNKKPTRTSFKCEECDVNLCVIGCFKEYHKPPQPPQ